MKTYILFFLLISSIVSCKQETSNKADESSIPPETSLKTNTFAIVIHGGAGYLTKDNITPEKETAYRAKLEEAARAGYTILKAGGSSLDAVEKAITILEDSPLFNAGKGAVFTHDKTNELDASIMNGKTLNAGASAGTKTVKNPISLARKIMEKSPHVLLSGAGADTFAKEQGLKIVLPEYFSTEENLKTLEDNKEKTAQTAFYDSEIKNAKFGTVGCVALDKQGNLAAGTSTGGMTNKRWGRIGDSPIIGAGTYANNNTCAVSSTGHGEYFIRNVVAYDISAMMEYSQKSLQEAAETVIQKKLTNLGGKGGVIAVDKNGNIIAEFNTPGMFRATINDKGELKIGLFKEDVF